MAPSMCFSLIIKIQCSHIAHSRFMKLRLDRVLRLDVPEMTPEEALKSLAPVPDFKPLNQEKHWTAPYPPYKPGWWQEFQPKH